MSATSLPAYPTYLVASLNTSVAQTAVGEVKQKGEEGGRGEGRERGRRWEEGGGKGEGGEYCNPLNGIYHVLNAHGDLQVPLLEGYRLILHSSL